jgi:hypothetical protein
MCNEPQIPLARLQLQQLEDVPFEYTLRVFGVTVYAQHMISQRTEFCDIASHHRLSFATTDFLMWQLDCQSLGSASLAMPLSQYMILWKLIIVVVPSVENFLRAWHVL